MTVFHRPDTPGSRVGTLEHDGHDTPDGPETTMRVVMTVEHDGP